MLGLIAAAFYLGVGALAALAALSAGGRRRAQGERRIWLAIALLFAALAASRIAGAEDQVERLLRAWLESRRAYDSRRSLQAPIAAALVAVGGLAGIALLLGLGNRGHDRAGRALAWATRASAAMVLLVMLRVASYHATDRLLYAPRHLNWVIDIGSAALVAWCAARYARLARRGPAPPGSAR